MGQILKNASWLVGVLAVASCQSQRTVSPQFSLRAVPRGEVVAAYGHSSTSSYPDASDYVEADTPAKPAQPARLLIPAPVYPSVTNTAPDPESASANREVTASSSRRGFDSLPGYHTVTRGDTLFSIGRRYGTSVEALKMANGLTSDIIFPGDKLAIPHS